MHFGIASQRILNSLHHEEGVTEVRDGVMICDHSIVCIQMHTYTRYSVPEAVGGQLLGVCSAFHHVGSWVLWHGGRFPYPASYDGFVDLGKLRTGEVKVPLPSAALQEFDPYL